MPQNFINVVIPPIPQELLYSIPSDLLPDIEVGQQVEVPLGKRLAHGFIVSTPKPLGGGELKFEIKDVKLRRKNFKFFLPEQLKFFRWVADYYCHPLAMVIKTALPPVAAQKFKKTVRLLATPAQPLKGSLEQRLYERLCRDAEPVQYAQLLKDYSRCGAVLRRMENKGILVIESEETVDRHLVSRPAPDWARRQVTLNRNQNQALESICRQIDERRFKAFLLHGVTGSGKTEVYIEALRHAALHGLGALIIVPEIALTPQLIDRFLGRLGSNMAVLHSALKRGTRWDAWRALIENQTSLALGARSAVFAPVQRLGLIIVDEEHESSYKQEEGLRYNARDLAVARAKLENCPVVLGSATPCMESFAHALSKKYHYLSLPERPGGMAPVEVKICDLGLVKPAGMPSRNISPQLFQSLNQTMLEKGQAFILFNRRGFASYLQCSACESIVQCPNCSVALTYHRTYHRLLCHYCGLGAPPPVFCPECQKQSPSSSPSAAHRKAASPSRAAQLVQRGAGTERVFEELKSLFPKAAIDRLDRDAVSSDESYRKILERVRCGVTDILVGTQMIAKGHDLPGVTLVGVVDCDVGLHMPDFRAGERIFQLLTQVSGRSGRGKHPGLVILQTRVAKHPSLVFTAARNFSAFAKYELKMRRELGYPPFTRLLRIIASAPDKDSPRLTLQSFQASLNLWKTKENLDLVVLGPAPAPIEKVKTRWRWHLIVKSLNSLAIRKAVQRLQVMRLKSKQVKVVFDIDPQDMM